VPRRDVNLSRRAIQGMYSFERGSRTLDAIRNILAKMKKGNMPQDTQPIARVPNGYEVDVVGARISYQDIPGGPVKVLNIDRS